MARAHLAIYKTPGYQSDEQKWVSELQKTGELFVDLKDVYVDFTCVVILLAISEYDNHQVDLVHNVLADPKLKQLPAYREFIKHFITDELAQWPLPEHESIVQNELLRDGEAATKKGAMEVDSNDKTWYYNMLRDRVIEHDIRVVAKYYTRINTIRLAEMLQLTVDKAEGISCDVFLFDVISRLSRIFIEDGNKRKHI